MQRHLCECRAVLGATNDDRDARLRDERSQPLGGKGWIEWDEVMPRVPTGDVTGGQGNIASHADADGITSRRGSSQEGVCEHSRALLHL